MKAFNLKTALQHPEKIQELYIHGLPIQEFPEAIFKLKQLRKLELTANQLSYIPEKICELEYLEELVLNDNQLRTLPDHLKELKKLRRVELDKNQFNDFPRVLFDCTSITKLSLRSNALTKIPNDIATLGQLTVLHLDGNQLTKLPQALGHLHRLEHFSISNNLLRQVPATIGNCSLLKSLIADQNKLKNLPAEIAMLSALEQLSLNGNKLSHFPQVILHCKALEKLSLRRCKLEALPKEIHELEGLQQIDLAYNKLQTLSKELTNLRYLRTLDLQSNVIEILPSSLHQLSNLKHLNISKNPLKRLPENLSQLNQLEELLIAGNWNLQEDTIDASSSLIVFCAAPTMKKYLAAPKDKIVQAILHFINELIICQNLSKLKISSRYLSASQLRILLKFIKTCRLQKIATDSRLAFFKLLLNDSSAKVLSKKILLQALSFKNLVVRKNALNILRNQHSLTIEQQALSSTSHLVFLGKSKLNTKAIKDRLAKTGITISDRFTAACSHVVLEWFPDASAYHGMELSNEKSFVILQEHQVMAYLTAMENSFLTTTQDEENLKKLSSLLLSNRTESVALALQILKTMNIPKALFTDLLIAFKSSNHPKHKRKIRALLKMYIDEKSNKLVKELDWNKCKDYSKSVLEEKLRGTNFEFDRLWEYLHGQK